MHEGPEVPGIEKGEKATLCGWIEVCWEYQRERNRMGELKDCTERGEAREGGRT